MQRGPEMTMKTFLHSTARHLTLLFALSFDFEIVRSLQIRTFKIASIPGGPTTISHKDSYHNMIQTFFLRLDVSSTFDGSY